MKEHAIRPYTTMESLRDLCRNLYERIGITKGGSEYFEYYASLPYLAYQNRMLLKALPSDAKEAYEVLEEAVRIAGDERCPMYITRCDDLDFPVDEYLESRGLQEKICQAGMSYLTGNGAGVPKHPILEVGEERLEEWCETFRKAFLKNDDSIVYETLLATGKCKYFACEEAGRLVAVGMCCRDTEGTNLGVHCIGTLEEFRGRGYAVSIMNRILQEAQKQQIPLLTLQASPFGEPVYTGMGFVKHTMIHSFA